MQNGGRWLLIGTLAALAWSCLSEGDGTRPIEGNGGAGGLENAQGGAECNLTPACCSATDHKPCLGLAQAEIRRASTVIPCSPSATIPGRSNQKRAPLRLVTLGAILSVLESRV